VLVAVAFTVGLTFASIELPRQAHEILVGRVASPGFDSASSPMNRERTEAWITHHHLRAIGYASLALVVGLIVTGFATRRTGLASLGAVALFLPVFAQFALEMFFLAGLGLLRLVWLPALDLSYGVLGLADAVRWPYDGAVALGSALGVRLGAWLPQLLMALGLMVFTLGTVDWFRARFGGPNTADQGVYRLSRHPQYLGWILWSYGLIFYVERLPRPKVTWGLASSLPWLLSTLVIVGVALAEELRMVQERGEEYRAYARRTPFLLPLPRGLSRAASAPMRWVTGAEWPRRVRDIVVVLVTYGALVLLLSAAPAGVRFLGETVGIERDEPVPVLVERIGQAEGRREKARAVGALEARGPEAVGPLIGLLGSEDSVIREFAAGALGRLGSERAVLPLIEALSRPDARSDVVLALGQLGSPEAVEPLLEHVDDPSARVRLHVFLALGRLGDERTLEALEGGLADPEDYVRAAAAEALGEMGPDEAIPLLSTALGDPSPRVRMTALYALSRFSSDEVVALLTSTLDAGDAEMRLYATEILRERGHPAR
jgi:protein-S-isoprenylcysteine O-methyltransferase Ste14